MTIRDRQRYTSSRHGLSVDMTYSAVLRPDPATPGNFIGTGRFGGKVKSVLVNPGQCSSTSMHEIEGVLETVSGSIGGGYLNYILIGEEQHINDSFMGTYYPSSGIIARSFSPGAKTVTFQDDNDQYQEDTCWGRISYQRWARIEFVRFDPDNPPPLPPIAKLPDTPDGPPITPAP